MMTFFVAMWFINPQGVTEYTIKAPTTSFETLDDCLANAERTAEAANSAPDNFKLQNMKGEPLTVGATCKPPLREGSVQ